MAEEPTARWILEHVQIKRTGNPRHPLDEYHPLVLNALMNKMDEEVEAAGHRADEEERAHLASYDGPLLTGDPIADEWERSIARGEEPDW